jgi:broad specificity phosphatase PhoE
MARRRTLTRSFWRWLRMWRDAKAIARGPRAYGARRVRRRMHSWINRTVR